MCVVNPVVEEHTSNLLGRDAVLSFEPRNQVEDLRNASPATVSRAGIIYVSDSDLDWQPVMESRLKKLSTARGDVLRGFFR